MVRAWTFPKRYFISAALECQFDVNSGTIGLCFQNNDFSRIYINKNINKTARIRAIPECSECLLRFMEPQ